MKYIYLVFLIYLISGCTTEPTVDSLHQRHNSNVRVQTIFKNILVANLHICPKHRKDYGLQAFWLHKDNTLENIQILKEAFNLKKQPTILTVIPNTASKRAGVQAGDVILAVNDVQWSTSSEEQTKLKEELNRALASPTMRLVVKRNENTLSLFLRGQDICNIYIHLVDDEGTMAYATHNNHIFIERGLEKLLNEDSELAYIISHEIAHVIYGHARVERKEDLENKSTRSLMEKEADAMAIQLMINAGYDVSGATTALKKTDYENRGPITRWLGYYGAYMPTEERIEFLKKVAYGIVK